ncbi:MAG TPA: hypothetical protein VJT74_09530, partial [Pyrinomonadaceae bacterium]|nr:hypothetical protein [Pyrinomonadaceae bacterium]
IVALGYGVSAALVCASASTLWPLPELKKPASGLKLAEVEDAANHVARKMKHLRLILYVGAVLLVLITFRHRNTLGWALDYAKPLPLLEGNPGFKNANVLYGNLEALVSNVVLATSVLNTLLLAGIYVPAALALQGRAAKLARVAVELEAKDAQKAEGAAKRVRLTWAAMTEKQEAWIKSHGLIHPFKEQMPKAIAILSPLLAGPIGELLNFFK